MAKKINDFSFMQGQERTSSIMQLIRAIAGGEIVTNKLDLMDLVYVKW